MRKPRLFYGAAFCALLFIEILIGLFVNDAFIRPYVGDVLVTVLLCSFLRIFFPKEIRTLPLYVFFFAVAVEISQYFDLVVLLGVQNQFVSILLGRTFSFLDILCYAVGCLIAAFLDRTVGNR